MTTDALLAALSDARQRRDEATDTIRVLLAWARELAAPRPYRLADLAEAAGMSISGVRTAYTAADIERARQLTPPSCGESFQAFRHAMSASRAPGDT